MTDPTAPGNGKARDEADRAKDGTLPKDPKADTKEVKGKELARVLTVPQILKASKARALEAQGRQFCSTGNYFIDEETGGIAPGDCWLLGADTNVGKSSAAVQIVDVNLKPPLNKRVLIVSSEDDEALYGDKLMCRRAQLDAKRYRSGRLTLEEWGRVNTTIASGEPVPVFMDGRSTPIEKLEPQIELLLKEQAIDVVIFDYLQEFRSNRHFQDERVKHKEIAAVMRRVVKTHKRSGIILSQLTFTEKTKMPTRHNIRESRDVSNAADTILILFMPAAPIYELDGEGKETDNTRFNAGERVMFVDKCKRGPRGQLFGMPWDDLTASFKVVPEPEAERLKREAERLSYDELYGGFEDGDAQ